MRNAVSAGFLVSIFALSSFGGTFVLKPKSFTNATQISEWRLGLLTTEMKRIEILTWNCLTFDRKYPGERKCWAILVNFASGRDAKTGAVSKVESIVLLLDMEVTKVPREKVDELVLQIEKGLSLQQDGKERWQAGPLLVSQSVFDLGPLLSEPQFSGVLGSLGQISIVVTGERDANSWLPGFQPNKRTIVVGLDSKDVSYLFKQEATDFLPQLTEASLAVDYQRLVRCLDDIKEKDAANDPRLKHAIDVVRVNLTNLGPKPVEQLRIIGVRNSLLATLEICRGLSKEGNETNPLLTDVDPNSIAKDDEFQVPDWKWVDLLNNTPVSARYSNGVGVLRKTDSCGIEFGGSVKVLRVDRRLQTARLIYTPPGQPMGTPCPEGVEFEISLGELSHFRSRYQQRRVEEATFRNDVQTILQGRSIQELGSLKVGQVIKGNRSMNWVTVVENVDQDFSNGVFVLEAGNPCLTQDDASLKILGFRTADSTALVEYSSPSRPKGTSCPEGSKFFVSVASLTSN